MPILFNEASFKNSRITTRPTTTNANTYAVTIASGSNTLISAANPNRTYITIRNTASAANEDLRYDYFDNPNILTEGFLLKAGEACDLESVQSVFARGTTVNVLCTIDEGEG
jgi:hypothetical protein